MLAHSFRDVHRDKVYMLSTRIYMSICVYTVFLKN
jgi:hypothetical protein